MSSFFPASSSFFPSGGGGGGGVTPESLGVRPFTGLTSDIDVYVDNDTGSDTTGDGSVGSPYASIRRALLDTPPLTRAGLLATIHLANTGTAYDYPYGFAALRYVLIVGDTSTEETRNITSVTFQSNDRGSAVIIDGAALTDDEWAGRTATVGGKRFNITRNVGNTVYGYRVGADGWNSNQSGLAPGPFALLSRPAIEVSHDLYVADCYFLGFQDIDFRCPAIYVEGANHIDWYSCTIYANNLGVLNGTSIMLGTQIVGTKIDLSSGSWLYRANCTHLGLNPTTKAVLSGSARPEVVIRKGSFLADWYGGFIHRNIQGIYVMGGLWQNFVQANTLYGVFDDEVVGEVSGPIYVSTRAPATESWPHGQGGAGTVRLMNCAGSVDEDYFVFAGGGAQVILDTAISVGTDTEDNAVSANDGASPSSWNADGTNITGGIPVYMPGHQFVGSSGTTTEAGRLYVDEAPIAGDDAAVPPWEGKVPAVAGGSNGAQGYQVSGEVVIPAGLIDGTPSVGDVLYVAEAAGVPADKGRWSTSKPTDSGDLQHHVGTVLEVITGTPNEYRVLLTPNSLTIEVA